MDESKCSQATPHGTLLEQVMNASLAKSEREWAAAREIETLRQQLNEADEALKAVERELEDVDYRGSYADGVMKLKGELTAERAISDKLEKAALEITSKGKKPNGGRLILEVDCMELESILAELAAMRKGETE